MQSFAVQVLQEAADPSVTGIFSFRGTVFVLKVELRNSPAGYLVCEFPINVTLNR